MLFFWQRLLTVFWTVKRPSGCSVSFSRWNMKVTRLFCGVNALRFAWSNNLTDEPFYCISQRIDVTSRNRSITTLFFQREAAVFSAKSRWWHFCSTASTGHIEHFDVLLHVKGNWRPQCFSYRGPPNFKLKIPTRNSILHDTIVPLWINIYPRAPAKL